MHGVPKEVYTSKINMTENDRSFELKQVRHTRAKTPEIGTGSQVREVRSPQMLVNVEDVRMNGSRGKGLAHSYTQKHGRLAR